MRMIKQRSCDNCVWQSPKNKNLCVSWVKDGSILKTQVVSERLCDRWQYTSGDSWLFKKFKIVRLISGIWIVIRMLSWQYLRYRFWSFLAGRKK